MLNLVYCMFLSETYEVIDAIAVDDGVNYGSNSLVKTVTDGVTTLSTQNDMYGIFYFSSTQYATSTYNIGEGECVSFDLISYEGTSRIRFNTIDLILTPNASITGNNHIRIVNNGDTASVYVDDVQINTVNISSESGITFRIRVENGATLTFKNLCYYPV